MAAITAGIPPSTQSRIMVRGGAWASATESMPSFERVARCSVWFFFDESPFAGTEAEPVFGGAFARASLIFFEFFFIRGNVTDRRLFRLAFFRLVLRQVLLLKLTFDEF